MPQPKSPKGKGSRWHAVSIVVGSRACDAARRLRLQRYLSREAPRLPLADCMTKDACACVYKHHADRRGGARRKDETMGLRRPAAVQPDRRQARGRRQDD